MFGTNIFSDEDGSVVFSPISLVISYETARQNVSEDYSPYFYRSQIIKINVHTPNGALNRVHVSSLVPCVCNNANSRRPCR